MTIYFQKNYSFFSDSSSDEEDVLTEIEKSTERARAQLKSFRERASVRPSEELRGRVTTEPTVCLTLPPVLTNIKNPPLYGYDFYKTPSLKDLNPSDSTLSFIFDFYTKVAANITEKDKKWLLNQEARIRATQNKELIEKWEKFKATVCHEQPSPEKLKS